MSGHLVRGVRVPTPLEPDGGALLDVLVSGGRIAAVEQAGTLAAPGGADDVLEGDGRLLLPGFVDAHVHGEAAVFDPDVQRAMLRQGVTTIVVGQDGIGFAPTPHDDAFAYSTEYFRAINGEHPTFRGGSVAALRATWAGLPVTVETLVPHGTLRHAVLGTADRPASPDETARMVALLETALDDGAVGLSTGLEYVPAAYATEDELVALARVCASRHVPHVSHMRGYEERAPRAFGELVRIARASGVATHVSHFHGPADVLTGLVDGAAAEGVDVTFDSYPYLRGSSILSMVALPTWLPIADPDRTVALLRDAAVRERLRTEHFPSLADLWGRVTMANVPGDLRWTEGMALVDVAARLGLAPQDTAVELLVATRLQAGCVFAQPPTNSPESVRTLANHRAHLAGSDAIYAGGRPHPRGWGAFARFAAEHVVAAGDWTWADAVDHLSARAARRFSLAGRGTVSVGARADLVLVDPSRVRDRATYEAPRTLADGIDDVLVRGRAVLRDGELVAPVPATDRTKELG
ncbi:N-acyl-D-amino-acid deacylase family protein [Luteimicrobium subarcticum]|uniref:N-acyl-D-amino-acid deacylase n=1 Tax=Luteimicrobium subarcticum TaxID=620910 RepID=A0A2M8WTJ1_9MICO|nr:amidohydrolase family protein [Luteimicrobium subarcticum]PJI94194.1 N-acyl-D-amino-acid deacylase [Luteimicrobium subarcticum]